MLGKVARVFALVSITLAVVGYTLYATNAAPIVRPVSVDEAATAGRPYVVKLHAQWCVKCRMTKGVWAEIEQAYAGRVHLVVLDFTTDANTEASRAEAKRLGLDRFFAEYEGATGVIVVLDARSKEVRAEISASRDFSEYQTAIDGALRAATVQSRFSGV